MKRAATFVQSSIRLWRAYRLRWKRRELLWRAIRAGRLLSPVVTRVDRIRADDVLLFAVIRNEASRLPEFLSHYRALGVAHFLIVDNGSQDGSTHILRAQPDVSLWRGDAGYRSTRFGMDLIGALLLRYGHRHWSLTVDADELLIYPDWENMPLPELTKHLDAENIPGIGALMIDLYPQGPIGQDSGKPSTPMTEKLPWFDRGPYRSSIVEPKLNRIVRGGVRERVFFPDTPDMSPTLNKLPLIRWHWRYVYVNSTHSMLPPSLNTLYDGPDDSRFSGALLHGKFLPDIVLKSQEELSRRQHFHDPDLFVEYHQAICRNPVLWREQSVRYAGWRQLVALGLMNVGTKAIIVENVEEPRESEGRRSAANGRIGVSDEMELKR